MKTADPHILTINGGSSSIKFALFEAGDSPVRILRGVIDRIGMPGSTLRVEGTDASGNFEPRHSRLSRQRGEPRRGA